MIHQVPTPITRPSSSDRNWYDRHWMNGFDAEGNVWFMVGIGLYPNRRVMDAHVSFVIGDEQHTLHASRRAPRDRRAVHVGPISLEIVEPLRTLRLLVDENEHGMSCDLVFTAVSIPFAEPDNVMYDEDRLLIHAARYSQRGFWNGSFTIDGVTHTLTDALAMRDRSWGIRPVGEPEAGAPGMTNDNPGAFLIWSSLVFDDEWFYYTCLEDVLGRTIQSTCDLIPLHFGEPMSSDETTTPMTGWAHHVQYVPGTRRAAGAQIVCRDGHGTEYEFDLQPFGRPFYMLGIGYQHPTWAHGLWKGELAIERETYDLTAIAPLDFPYLHLSQRCNVTHGDRRGFGTLENLVIGKCERYGFQQFLDGAP
jgi:hypothetical protein